MTVTTTTVGRVQSFIRQFAGHVPKQALLSKPLASSALAPLLSLFGTNRSLPDPNAPAAALLAPVPAEPTPSRQLASRLAASPPVAETAAPRNFRFGTPTLMAAWNAAVYVAQIEDERLAALARGQFTLKDDRDGLTVT